MAEAKQGDTVAAKANTGASTSQGFKEIDFTVEIAGPRNQNVVCPYDQQKLRGRWQRDRNGMAEPGDDIRRMPAVPGICLRVSLSRKAVRRFDPLTQPQNSTALKKIKKVAQQVNGGQEVGPEDTVVWNMTDTEIKTFILWVRRLLDQEFCVVHSGEVPEFEQIQKLPGDFIIGQFDQGQTGDRLVKSQDYRYRRPSTKLATEFSEDPQVTIETEEDAGDDE